MDVIFENGWAGAAWQACLTLTVALACLTVLRRPWRLLFGAESAYTLWLAVPLSLLFTAAPYREASHFTTVAMHLRDVVTPLAQGLVAPSTTATWRFYLPGIWLAGVACVGAGLAFAQFRYVRALGKAVVSPAQWGFPVLHAPRRDMGPAQVGVLRPRIVLPSDFATRFSSEEQRLVIEHEAIHARRRDCAWNATAHGLITLAWFHPLAWWALRAFRADQELACDAAVIRRHPGARRAYAEALLKSQSVTNVPLGCALSTTHPLKERITMLTASPTRRRHHAAMLLLPLALAGVAASAWSASPAAQGTKPQYQLEASIASSDGNNAHVIVCAYEGQPASISPAANDGAPSWMVTFTVTPATQAGMFDVAIESTAEHDKHRLTSRQILRGKPGEAMAVRFGSGADSGLRAIEFLPSKGCAASGRTNA